MALSDQPGECQGLCQISRISLDSKKYIYYNDDNDRMNLRRSQSSPSFNMSSLRAKHQAYPINRTLFHYYLFYLSFTFLTYLPPVEQELSSLL